MRSIPVKFCDHTTSVAQLGLLDLTTVTELYDCYIITAVKFSVTEQCLNKGFDGPAFGPKMSEENKREFSEEQLRAGREGHIGLQAGSNKGATQSGVNMGKPRSVHD